MKKQFNRYVQTVACCKDCKERTNTCHSPGVCERYSEEVRKYREIQEQMRKERRLHNDIQGILSKNKRKK